jgi:hypothetical protein
MNVILVIAIHLALIFVSIRESNGYRSYGGDRFHVSVYQGQNRRIGHRRLGSNGMIVQRHGVRRRQLDPQPYRKSPSDRRKRRSRRRRKYRPKQRRSSKHRKRRGLLEIRVKFIHKISNT